MKLISSRGTRVLERKPRMKRPALPDLKKFTKTQATVYVSDTEQGVMAAMMDGLYFGR